MTQPLNYHYGLTPPFDRSGRVIAAGVVLILCGLMAALFAAMVPVAMMIPQPAANAQQVRPGALVVASVMYATLAAVLFGLGLGATLRRRWAQPLILILTTHWLIAGVLTLVIMAVMTPVFREIMLKGQPGTTPIPRNMVGGIIGGMLGLLAVVMIFLPGLLLLLMRGTNVQLTLQHHDHRTRWTDGVPLSLLGLSLTLLLMGVLVLTSVPTAAVPMFGRILTGMPARVLLLVVAAAFLLAAWWTYRRQMRGWWLGLAALVLPMLVALPSMFLMSIEDYQHALGTPQEQIDMLLKHERMLLLSTAAMLVILTAAMLLYMLRLRPMFSQNAAPSALPD